MSGVPSDLRRGLITHLAGELAAAEAAYRLALGNPALAPAARHHLIRLLEGQARWDEALELRRADCAAAPDDAEAAVGLGMALLGLGRYGEGWPLFEARKRLPNVGRYLPRVSYPEWDGRPVGALTVWDEQGVGDTLQFVRFLPILKARGIEVTFVCRGELTSLLGELPVKVVAADQAASLPPADAWAMLDSLPGRMGVTLETLPAAMPYLAVPAARRERWAKRIGPGTHIGVVTHGNPRHPNDAHRSLPAEAAALLLTLPGAVTLTPGAGPLVLEDFADTAAALERMALVITVDTAVAHLAGALGRPCWVLLPHLGVDWRWLHERTDSPWYPSLRLYRQPAAGDWASALKQLGADLPGFFAQAGPPPAG
ncbi:hypothetical protein [Phenylobacterium sp.]|uniref:hypothetical protein n=1 Tax=Phenylobacterium sp. TaxID=1871053 RepID=UPI002F41F619